MLRAVESLNMQFSNDQKPVAGSRNLREIAYNILTAEFLKQRVAIRATESKPPKLLFTDELSEIEFYARTPFTAFEYALENNCPHPKLWDIIRGAAYERPYLQRFGPQN